MESRYLTSAILPKRLSCSASRGPALVFAPFLSSPHAVECRISESGQSCTGFAGGGCDCDDQPVSGGFVGVLEAGGGGGEREEQESNHGGKYA